MDSPGTGDECPAAAPMGVDTVRILAPDVSDPFFSGLVRCNETLLYDAGYVCFVCDTGNDVECARRNLESLAQRQVSGLVLAYGCYELGDLGVADGLPVVEVDSPMRTARPWTVAVPRGVGGRQAALRACWWTALA